jgi:hypothetical protein
MVDIREAIEAKRGCGYRSGGGTYIVTDKGVHAPCGKLPFILERCPTCSGGIKFCRSWTWINPAALFAARGCAPDPVPFDPTAGCRACPLKDPPEQAGLLWIGEKFYPTPADWMKEADRMGVSRRLPAVPNGFVLGETWVLVAHKKAVELPCDACRERQRTALNPAELQHLCEACKGKGVIHRPAIFHAFKPQRIEYVVKGDETEEELERIVKRGIELVRVTPAPEPGTLPMEAGS